MHCKTGKYIYCNEPSQYTARPFHKRIYSASNILWGMQVCSMNYFVFKFCFFGLQRSLSCTEHWHSIMITLFNVQTVTSKFFLTKVLFFSMAYTMLYTGCPRRNVPDFGRMFLVLKYTDITQNTFIQSWTVTEIMAREKCGILAVPLIVLVKPTR